MNWKQHRTKRHKWMRTYKNRTQIQTQPTSSPVSLFGINYLNHWPFFFQFPVRDQTDISFQVKELSSHLLEKLSSLKSEVEFAERIRKILSNAQLQIQTEVTLYLFPHSRFLLNILPVFWLTTMPKYEADLWLRSFKMKTFCVCCFCKCWT